MARLPDPTDHLDDEAQALVAHINSVRSHAEGTQKTSNVYGRMLNNVGVAEKVSALGEHLRFHGTLPDDVRELVILRTARRLGFRYEWSHHQRAAHLAGIDPTVLEALGADHTPGTEDFPSLRGDQVAAIAAVDAVVSRRSIPEGVQDRIVGAHGTAGAVEVVALCGLYTLMGYMTTAFDIDLEPGFPAPPF